MTKPDSSAWNRALTLTAPYARGGGSTLPALLAAAAGSHGENPALIDEAQTLTYAELAAQVNRYARWALLQDVAPGDVVALMLPNCADYVAIWLGITSVRGVVALINPQISGDGLAQALAAVQPRHVITDCDGARALLAVADQLPADMQTWSFGPGGSFARVEDAAAQLSPAPLELPGERTAALTDLALYIYTSGTTGPPKAARISHRRVAEWSLWFAGMIDTQPSDRMFNCLPMFHSVGGVVAIGAMLAGGGSVLIRRSFSASRFWDDVVTHRCTVFQYIGELCRHILNSDAEPVGRHSLRLCCGNGLRGEVWTAFAERFDIPHILEFYASTEGNVSLYNVPGRPGAIGHLPGFLAHRAPVILAQCDAESGALLRGADGLARVCQPGETGEALGRIASRAFEGYTDQDATAAKIARDVLAAGDAWYRTGDLMQRDTAGYFTFVDRLGDNFRWKGENIASAWVADTLCRAPGVRDAVVYGVAVPGHEGRAGMAAVTVNADFMLERLHAHLTQHLPGYAWPVFVRIVPNISATATFKPLRAALAREGYDPASVKDRLYAFDKARAAYLCLDAAMLYSIVSGKVRI